MADDGELIGTADEIAILAVPDFRDLDDRSLDRAGLCIKVSRMGTSYWVPISRGSVAYCTQDAPLPTEVPTHACACADMTNYGEPGGLTSTMRRPG